MTLLRSLLWLFKRSCRSRQLIDTCPALLPFYDRLDQISLAVMYSPLVAAVTCHLALSSVVLVHVADLAQLEPLGGS